MKRLVGFDVTGIPTEGYYSEEYWFIRPKDEWEVRGNGLWLDIGGPGVDGISWALKWGKRDVYAYYPIEDDFQWKAKDVQSLIIGWQAGEIWV